MPCGPSQEARKVSAGTERERGVLCVKCTKGGNFAFWAYLDVLLGMYLCMCARYYCTIYTTIYTYIDRQGFVGLVIYMRAS